MCVCVFTFLSVDFVDKAKKWRTFFGAIDHIPAQDYSIIDDDDAPRAYVDEVVEKLSQFATEKQIHAWQQEMVLQEVDYNDRVELTAWYENKVKLFAPRIVGHRSCTRKISLYTVDIPRLPKSNTITHNVRERWVDVCVKCPVPPITLCNSFSCF